MAIAMMLPAEDWKQEAVQTTLEGLRGWSWRNHEGETRLGGVVIGTQNRLRPSGFCLLQPSACLFLHSTLFLYSAEARCPPSSGQF